MQLSSKISSSVTLFLAVALFISAAAFIIQGYINFQSDVRKQAENSLNIFQAIHIQAMLHRGDTLDNNPVIATMDGTMVQLSKNADRFSLWTVMASKVIAFQQKMGHEEIEPPKDDIDREAIEMGAIVGRMVDNDIFRLTTPVILGQGEATRDKCFECHGKLMGIKGGEVIGAYSIALSAKELWADFMRIVETVIAIALFVSILISGISVFLLNRMASGPITRMTGVMMKLAGGNTQVEVTDLGREDEIGDMAKTMEVFKENAIKRIEAEESLKLALTQSEAAIRVKSNLLANMSHELRTPLNAIIGFSDAMKNEIFGPIGNDKYKEYLTDIYFSGQHLLELINDILDASALEAGALELREENINLTDVINETVRLIEPRAEAGKVTVTSSPDPDLPSLYADRRRLKQVMLNLLSNAVKFTEAGGEVYASAWLNDDGSLAVAVDDSGVGMDQGEIEKAMSVFGQVDSGHDRMHEGSGLGLPLTQGLMELHGGTLQIKSKKGNGTLVTVTFPRERVVQDVC